MLMIMPVDPWPTPHDPGEAPVASRKPSKAELAQRAMRLEIQQMRDSEARLDRVFKWFRETQKA